ncbi:unnamed protein product [Protopolystoma xenopodis]|uniref:Uncharacterized protein n=1 Tax=Protopolystoma xenopodis TaxID=117903 RepID=A0A3S5CUG3_9PLAT|nr:unnamed protein product [Protopolystoma xenopodis]
MNPSSAHHPPSAPNSIATVTSFISGTNTTPALSFSCSSANSGPGVSSLIAYTNSSSNTVCATTASLTRCGPLLFTIAPASVTTTGTFVSGAAGLGYSTITPSVATLSTAPTAVITTISNVSSCNTTNTTSGSGIVPSGIGLAAVDIAPLSVSPGLQSSNRSPTRTLYVAGLTVGPTGPVTADQLRLAFRKFGEIIVSFILSLCV